jgi:hypothetical protein
MLFDIRGRNFEEKEGGKIERGSAIVWTKGAV